MPRKLLRRLLPDPNRVREHRWLAWLGPSLHHPRVWHISRKGIALGTAIGLFFGMLSPIAQMPLAGAFAITLRANLPMALAGTFITNPFTFAPLYYLAYRLGMVLIGGDPSADPTALSFDFSALQFADWFDTWPQHLMNFGKPLLAGLLVMASGFALAGYFSVHWIWRVLIVRAWRQRSQPNS